MQDNIIILGNKDNCIKIQTTINWNIKFDFDMIQPTDYNYRYGAYWECDHLGHMCKTIPVTYCINNEPIFHTFIDIPLNKLTTYYHIMDKNFEKLYIGLEKNENTCLNHYPHIEYNKPIWRHSTPLNNNITIKLDENNRMQLTKDLFVMYLFVCQIKNKHEMLEELINKTKN